MAGMAWGVPPKGFNGGHSTSSACRRQTKAIPRAPAQTALGDVLVGGVEGAQVGAGRPVRGRWPRCAARSGCHEAAAGLVHGGEVADLEVAPVGEQQRARRLSASRWCGRSAAVSPVSPTREIVPSGNSIVVCGSTAPGLTVLNRPEVRHRLAALLDVADTRTQVIQHVADAARLEKRALRMKPHARVSFCYWPKLSSTTNTNPQLAGRGVEAERDERHDADIARAEYGPAGGVPSRICPARPRHRVVPALPHGAALTDDSLGDAGAHLLAPAARWWLGRPCAALGVAPAPRQPAGAGAWAEFVGGLTLARASVLR